MKIAQIQMPVFINKIESINLVKKLIEKEVPKDVDLICLPEMFCCPYEMEKFPIYAEKERGNTWQICSQLAKERNVYLSAGSIAEVDDEGFVYNTAYVFNRDGEQIAKHRKMHLFDIQIEGGQHFQESATLKAGNSVTTFDTEFGKLGLCICYDIRFVELTRLMTLKGAKIILVPAAFNMSTGPSHWETLFKSQALNNQVFVIGTAPARVETASYKSWGHSIITNPWGDIISQANEKMSVLINDIDLTEVEKIRNQLPVLLHRREDVYSIKEINS